MERKEEASSGFEVNFGDVVLEPKTMRFSIPKLTAKVPYGMPSTNGVPSSGMDIEKEMLLKRLRLEQRFRDVVTGGLAMAGLLAIMRGAVILLTRCN